MQVRGRSVRLAPASVRISQDAFRLGTELATLTHGHPTGAPDGGVAVLILALTDGASLRRVIGRQTPAAAEPGHEETLCAIEMVE